MKETRAQIFERLAYMGHISSNRCKVARILRLAWNVTSKPSDKNLVALRTAIEKLGIPP